MTLLEWLAVPNADGSKKRKYRFAKAIGVTQTMVTEYRGWEKFGVPGDLLTQDGSHCPRSPGWLRYAQRLFAGRRMTASMHSDDIVLWRDRLVDQRSKIAGSAGDNRRPRAHNVECWRLFVDRPAILGSHRDPAEILNSEISSQIPQPGYSIDIDGFEARKVGHKPFGHFHFHSLVVACRPADISRETSVEKQCGIRNLSLLATGDGNYISDRIGSAA